MLVLTREPYDEIYIIDSRTNEQVAVITFLGVKGKQSRVGIDASRRYLVHRGEIWARVQNERTEPNGNTTG